MEVSQVQRRLPIGAEIIPGHGVHFRVWAPRFKNVEVVLESIDSPPQFFPMTPEEKGYFSALIGEAQVGTRYRFRLGEESILYPDPASRYQPEGPHGSSQVIDPTTFTWTDQHWKGVTIGSQVLYEMHIGTFSREGTWERAKLELLELAELGITVVEMMPIADFSGHFGWGYDGVNLFAPTHLYGQPDDLRHFIDYAHALGIAVILDVVYNHLGPDGNYIGAFSPHYFTDKYSTEWGEAINFDGAHAAEVRQFYIHNAVYWITEYHFDGLRFDATQNIYDASSRHILSEINEKVRAAAAPRRLYLIAESETQQTYLVEPIEEGGYGLDAVWNDDFHHTALVRLTGRNESYYTDYLGTVQEFISAIKYGYLYQGQWYTWQNKKRGTPCFHLNPACFINFIQNHDQVANSAHGLRIHQLTDPGSYRAITALMLLAPGSPMLLQGQEFASSSPFYYFADHEEELAHLVFQGRRDYFKQFATIATPEIQAALPAPSDPHTFIKCKLNFTEREHHHQAYALHRDLLRLRRNDTVFNASQLKGVDGAVLSPDAFLLRYFGDEVDTRILIINFGVDLWLNPAPEPLLAPPPGMDWEILWSSESYIYGGGGTPPLITNHNWCILGHSAIAFIPKKHEIE